MSKLIIVGHINPDTDSIVSAIAAQEYFSNVLGKEALAKRAGEINNETKFVLENLGIAIPELVSSIGEDEAVALVDHNQKSQVCDGVEYEKIEYILDHHNISIETDRPIYCHIEPIGSTSSVIAKLMFEKKAEISEQAAKLMLAGILSDTLNLTSPTTTEEDKVIVQKLNEIAKLDIKSFVDAMFEAKSSLEGISVNDIVSLDYKIFEMGVHKVGVGTWETTSPAAVNEKKDEIVEALKAKKETEGLDYIYFMVVDIIKQFCQLYVIGEKEVEIAEKVFGNKTADGIMELPGVVSRKKQIIPQLTEELSK